MLHVIIWTIIGIVIGILASIIFASVVLASMVQRFAGGMRGMAAKGMSMPTKARLFMWATSATARGLAWTLAAYCGENSVQAHDSGIRIAHALATLVLIGISIYSSIKSRKNIHTIATAEAHASMNGAAITLVNALVETVGPGAAPGAPTVTGNSVAG
jgi:uncharacterized membrane protein (UPF0136 family)